MTAPARRRTPPDVGAGDLGRIFGHRAEGFSAACGACEGVYTLPRGLRTPEEARERAREEGWIYSTLFGWTCPTCRFTMGRPLQEAPALPASRRRHLQEVPKRLPLPPWRRVVALVTVPDAHGTRRRAELMECGHRLLLADGTPSMTRRRRCHDCLAEMLSP